MTCISCRILASSPALTTLVPGLCQCWVREHNFMYTCILPPGGTCKLLQENANLGVLERGKHRNDYQRAGHGTSR